MWSHISILLVPASGSLKKQNAARVLVGWSIGKRKLLEIVFRGARARPQHNERVWHLAPVKYTHLILLNAWAKQTPLLGKAWQRRGGRAIKKYPRSFKRRGRGGSFKLQNNFS